MWGSIVDRSMFDSIHLCDSFIIRLFLFSTSKSCFIQRYEIVKCHNRWFSLHLSHNANETHTKDRHRDGQQRDREEAILATRPALASHNKTTTNRLVRHGHHDYQQEAVHRKADVLLPSVSVCTEKGMTQRSTSCLMAGSPFKFLVFRCFLQGVRSSSPELFSVVVCLFIASMVFVFSINTSTVSISWKQFLVLSHSLPVHPHFFWRRNNTLDHYSWLFPQCRSDLLELCRKLGYWAYPTKLEVFPRNRSLDSIYNNRFHLILANGAWSWPSQHSQHLIFLGSTTSSKWNNQYDQTFSMSCIKTKTPVEISEIFILAKSLGDNVFHNSMHFPWAPLHFLWRSWLLWHAHFSTALFYGHQTSKVHISTIN